MKIGMPAKSGIVSNQWWDRAEGKAVTSVSDDKVWLLGGTGSAEGSSPARLLVSTVGDELKNSGKGGKVIGISLKDRSAILPGGKKADAAHAEFQRAGFFLTHILECPVESESAMTTALPSLMEQRLVAVAVRVRRSLKPKRVVLISRALETILEKIAALQLGCPLILDNGKPFVLDGSDTQKAVASLRGVVGASAG